MSFFERIARSKFFIKLTNWEYWPFGILQAPFFLYWIWLSIKARSFFFFSASNPSIYSGGMLGESKKEALDLVPEEYKPKTILVRLPATVDTVSNAMKEVGLSFPVILKPDIGERGFMVRKINNDAEVSQYINEVPTDFLVQEFVNLPLEFGVFYVRKPSDSAGKVVSINSKEMLTVTGNGKETLAELVYKNGRAHLQGERLQKIFAVRWNSIIPIDEIIELNSIGNHCLGTKFMNGNNLITPALIDSFDILSKRVKGFYFGRYDLRCASLADLENGNVKIIELNGCGAEPAHIYQPGFSFWQALKVIYNHWRLLYEISVENHKRGVPYITFAEARKTYLRTKKIFSQA